MLCTVFLSQGDQGLQGPPGPFEYVDPPEDFYIKGEQVEFIDSTVVVEFVLLYICNAMFAFSLVFVV